MRNTHRGKVVTGLGALLGLCLAGCEPGALFTLPPEPGTTSARPLMQSPPSVQLMQPRAGAEEPSEVRQVVAVSVSTPAFRPADTQYPGGSVVASSWRPMLPPGQGTPPQMNSVQMIPAPTDIQGPVIGPELQITVPGIGGGKETPVVEKSVPSEHLPSMPRMVVGGGPLAAPPTHPVTSGPHGPH